MVYASSISEKHMPSKVDYRRKDDILEIFDSSKSKNQLQEMIDKYDVNNEGILVLITSYSNATFFITVKLR